MNEKLGKLIVLIKYAALPLVIYFLTKYFIKSLHELANVQAKLNLSYLFLSYVALFFCVLLLPVIWHFITVKLKCNFRIRDSVYFRLLSELGKYLPGRILGYGFLMLKYKEKGMETKKVFLCQYYEIALSVLSSITTSLLCIIFVKRVGLRPYKNYFLILFILVLLAIHPVFLKPINRWIARFGKKTTFPEMLKYKEILIILALYNLYWFVFGFAFFFFVNSFVYLKIEHYFYLTGSFALSTLIGFLAFVLPAGMGAREGSLIVFLNQIMRHPFSSVVSIASRLWMISGEIAVLLAVSLAGKGRSIGSPQISK